MKTGVGAGLGADACDAGADGAGFGASERAIGEFLMQCQSLLSGLILQASYKDAAKAGRNCGDNVAGTDPMRSVVSQAS
ncbi:hypothetical protein Z946_3780 [Sulfitobacter noctilucicola]|nr:hypothetical protein Z946_3780 [Sulfitobacter noctilucicola]